MCGSITTFSTWQAESSKLFFLQFDTSWGNVGTTYNGGRLLDWLVQCWLGVGLPLLALRAGQHTSLAVFGHPVVTSPVPQPLPSAPQRAAVKERDVADDNDGDDDGDDDTGGDNAVTVTVAAPAAGVSNTSTATVAQATAATHPRRAARHHGVLEVCLVVSFVVATVVLVVAPLTSGWTFVTIATMLAPPGVYLRYAASKALNREGSVARLCPCLSRYPVLNKLPVRTVRAVWSFVDLRVGAGTCTYR